MASRLGKTKKMRNAKLRKFGANSKRERQNKGTTASFPLEGPIPALRFGRPVAAESIVVPADLLKA
jgi:hypothetical protein